MKTKNKIILGIAVFFAVQIMLMTFASALTIDSVSVSPEQTSPGQSISISIGITNNDNVEATNLAGSLDLTNVPFKISDISGAFLDKLKRDNSDSLNFDLDALSNAKTGIYSVSLLITYNEDNKTLTKNSLVTLTVTSPPILDVRAQEGTLIRGQNNDISLQVTNKGISDAKFLEMQIEENGYTLLSPSISYIGDVDSNDFQTASFNIFIPATSSSTISIPVTINYNDVLNKQYTQQFSVNARVYSLQEAQSLGLVAKSSIGTYIFIIILLIVAYIIYRIIKRALKKRKEKKEQV